MTPQIGGSWGTLHFLCQSRVATTLRKKGPFGFFFLLEKEEMHWPELAVIPRKYSLSLIGNV